MDYPVIAVAIVTAALLLGVWGGRRINSWCDAHRAASAALLISSAVGWLVLAYAARRYADGDGPGWAVAEWFAHRGKWYVFTFAVLLVMGAATHSHDLGRMRKTALLLVEILVILVMVWRTMPSFVWLPRSYNRDRQGHLCQTIEYTCGPVCLGNLLESGFGRPSPTERELARLSGTTVEGTPLRGVIAAAKALGLDLVACRTMSLDELRPPGAGAIVQISTIPAVKHATLLLRLHDDNLEFIDPAYGYGQVTAARFRATWFGKTLLFRESKGGAPADPHALPLRRQAP